MGADMVSARVHERVGRVNRGMKESDMGADMVSARVYERVVKGHYGHVRERHGGGHGVYVTRVVRVYQGYGERHGGRPWCLRQAGEGC
jgi:hypothetical protein